MISRIRNWAMVALALMALSTGAYAQSLDITSGGGDGGPIEILADDGIEWNQETKVFIARGNAKAIRATVTIDSDVLRAYYREINGKTEVWRMDAEGSVVMRSPTETIYGDNAIYDVVNGVLVVRGESIRFEAGDDLITAEQQLEYWEIKQMAVARGDAVIKRPDRTMYADVLASHFSRDAEGNTTVNRVDAYDDVKIVTATDTITADRGVYNVDTGIATLTGSVVLLRADNTLSGCKAIVDMNTSISKLFACENGTGTRVQGTFQPESNPEADPGQ
jgi:lipopolysaccharide export system protein LptA